MSLDPTQLTALVSDVGIGVFADTYKAEALKFPSFCEVITPEACSVPFYGDKSTTLHFGGDAVEREDGQAIQEQSAGLGYTPQGKVRQFAAKISIPARMLAAVNAKQQVESMVSTWSRQFALRKMTSTERMVFSLIQRGGITAGDPSVFVNSFVGHETTNGLIYDGVSFFNSAHPVKFGTTTYDNADALTLTGPNLTTELVKAQSTNAVDEKGQPIDITSDILVVGLGDEATAMSLIGSTLAPGTNNNDINTNLNRLRIVSSRYITTSGAWAIGRTGTIRVIDSGPVPVLESSYNANTKCYDYSLEYHFGAYVRDWRGWIGNNFATS